MRSIWNSIRSTVTVIIIITVCAFVMVFTYLGTLEAKEGLRVLEVFGLTTLAYYFSKPRTNGDKPDELLKPTNPPK